MRLQLNGIFGLGLTLAAIFASSLPVDAVTPNNITTAPVPRAPGMTARAVANAQVSTGLSAADRTYMVSVLAATRQIDPAINKLDYRSLDIAIFNERSSTVLYNRPDLRSSLSVERPQSHSFAPAQSPTPIENHDTGPYRRIFSAPNNPAAGALYTAEIAQVSNVCNAGNVINKSLPDGSGLKDSGQIYMGGRGHVTVGGTYTDIDAGLNYNKDINLHQPSGQNSLDDYGLFMHATWSPVYLGTQYDKTTRQTVTGSFGHVPCSNYLTTLSFAVENPGNSLVPGYGSVEFVTTMTFYDYRVGRNRGVLLIYDYNLPYDIGWDAACRGCQLKRTTSIAQFAKPKGVGDNFTNGDHFSTTWSGAQLTCGMISPSDCQNNGSGYWDGATLTYGGTCNEHPHWYQSYDAAHRDCTSEPAAAQNQGGGIVTVQNFTPWSEYDYISLPVPLPPPGP